MESTPLLNDAESLRGISDKAVRHGFIQKVYGILLVQLTLTTLMAWLIMKYCSHISFTLRTVLLLSSLVLAIASMCTFIANPRLMRETPTNYFIILVFTLAESVAVGFVCVAYTKETVLIAIGVTALCVFGLTLFACQTTFDITGFAPYLLCALFAMLGIGFTMMIASLCGLYGPAFHTLRLIYAGLGTIVFSFYIVFDTQRIVGGKHEFMEFTIDDYVPAAIALYLDILNLFLFLLQLLGDRK